MKENYKRCTQNHRKHIHTTKSKIPENPAIPSVLVHFCKKMLFVKQERLLFLKSFFMNTQDVFTFLHALRFHTRILSKSCTCWAKTILLDLLYKASGFQSVIKYISNSCGHTSALKPTVFAFLNFGRVGIVRSKSFTFSFLLSSSYPFSLFMFSLLFVFVCGGGRFFPPTGGLLNRAKSDRGPLNQQKLSKPEEKQ